MKDTVVCRTMMWTLGISKERTSDQLFYCLQLWSEQASPNVEYREQCLGLLIPPDAQAESPTTAAAGGTQ